jgi:hypothetical protein
VCFSQAGVALGLVPPPTPIPGGKRATRAVGAIARSPAVGSLAENISGPDAETPFPNEWTPYSIQTAWLNKQLQECLTLAVHMSSGDTLEYKYSITDDGMESFFHCEEQLPSKMHNPRDLLKEALGDAHPAAVVAYNQVLSGMRSRSDETVRTRFCIKLDFQVQEQIIESCLLSTKSHQRILVVHMLAPETNYHAKKTNNKRKEVND